MSIRDRRLSSSDTDSSDSDHEGGSGLVDLFSFLQWRGEQLDDHPNRSPLSDLQSRSKDIKEAALHRVLNAAEQASQLRHEKSQQLHADLERLRADISKRVDSLSDSWNDTRNVRFRDKWSFVMGVTTIVTTSMALVARPEWVPLMYSALAVWYLPIRVYQYAVQKPWGYFLLDWCYVSNNLSLIYLWLAPQSVFLWTVCYCSAHGPLAFSVAAWRNSLVFHSLDKVTSVFIHLYPPLVFHSIRFLVPDQVRVRDYPAATQTSSLDLKTSIGFCFFVYAVWQAAYLYFISYRKGEKIRAGKRINSFSTMSTGKGAIGHFISSVPLLWREPFFIFLQFLYTFITILPAPLLFYKNERLAACFLCIIFVVAVYNGGSFYVEVFGRKFEKQLKALEKQIQEAHATEHAEGEAEAEAITTSSPQTRAAEAELRKR